MQDGDSCTITFYGGYKELKPIKYTIKKVIKWKWWIFEQVEFHIETDFGTVTGIERLSECFAYLHSAGVKDIDIIISKE